MATLSVYFGIYTESVAQRWKRILTSSHHDVKSKSVQSVFLGRIFTAEAATGHYSGDDVTNGSDNTKNSSKFDIACE